MATLNYVQLAMLANQAGFPLSVVPTMAAIALAESGGDPNALNASDNGGRQSSYGLWQISTGTHAPPTPNWMIPAVNAQLALEKYRQQGLGAWGTYTSGAYRKYLLLGGVPTLAPTAAQVWPWLRLNSITQRFGQNGENGVDIGLPLGTPITSLTNGSVLDTGYYGGGGVVSVRSDGIPGLGVASVYYQHLDTIAVVPGQLVHVGDAIGTSGGQLRGGNHPVTCCSTGPHLEVGLNCPTGAQSIWRPLGPNIDPLPWLTGLVRSGPGLLAGGGPITTIDTAFTTELGQVSGRSSGPIDDSFAAVCRALDAACAFEPLSAFSQGNWLTDITGLSALQGLFAVPAWVGANLIPMSVRAMFVLLGLLIVVMFLAQMALAVAKEAAPVAIEAATGGAV